MKVFYILMLLSTFFVAGCVEIPNKNNVMRKSNNYNGEVYVNEKPISLFDWANTFGYLKRQITSTSVPVPAKELPVIGITREQLQQVPEETVVYRLGHSSLLIQSAGSTWLIDPIFSDRASPVQWAGPERFHPVPLNVEDLPRVSGLIISHDHYDHLDYQTITELVEKVDHFIVPLGVNNHLLRWGVPAEKIVALDWWESVTVDGAELVATPAQHFSGRGLLDTNGTLWASWVMQFADSKIFYSGDTGYFDGFAKIGENYGPFDLTIIETGAYDKDWPDVHMQPEQSVQAHIDLGGKYYMPVHNGTFNLAFHSWYEPFERAKAIAQDQEVILLTPMMGEPIVVAKPSKTESWWTTQVSHF